MNSHLRKLRHLLWLLLPFLVWWALRNVSLPEVIQVLNSFGLVKILVFLGVNLLIIFLFSSRWWLILRAQGQVIPVSSLVGIRLAGFSISYFTPGTQIGGEPLQVRLLQKHAQIQSSIALASVSLDKLFELISNFTFLAIGATIILTTGLLHESPPLLGIIFWVLFLFSPIAYLLSLRAGHQPVGRVINWINGNKADRLRLYKYIPLVVSTEMHIGTLIKEKPLKVTWIFLSSVLIWIVMLAEYWLLLNFLNTPLNIIQTFTALTAARLAFLTPLPGGFGALEASQVLVIQAMGFEPAVGISASLMIRARDITFGIVGLALVAILTNKHRRLSTTVQLGD